MGLWLGNPPEPGCHPTVPRDKAFGPVGGSHEPCGLVCPCVPRVWKAEFFTGFGSITLHLERRLWKPLNLATLWGGFCNWHVVSPGDILKEVVLGFDGPYQTFASAGVVNSQWHIFYEVTPQGPGFNQLFALEDRNATYFRCLGVNQFDAVNNGHFVSCSITPLYG